METVRDLLKIKLRQTKETVRQLTKESEILWREIENKVARGGTEWLGIKSRVRDRVSRVWKIERLKRDRKIKWLVRKHQETENNETVATSSAGVVSTPAQ